MSSMVQFKNLVISHSTLPKELRVAVTNLMNAIDTDLDIQGYVQSSDVDDAINDLDKALIDFDNLITDAKEEDAIVIQRNTRNDPPAGYIDREDFENDNS